MNTQNTPFKENNFGDTPLMKACRFNQNPDIIKALIKAGAKVNMKNEIGMSALMFASGYNSAEIVNILIQEKADVNATDIFGDTPLIKACCSNENIAVIKLLIESNADINAKNFDGETALSMASQFNKNPKIIKTLIDLGANINTADKNKLLLCAVQSNASLEIINALIQSGADVNIRDNEIGVNPKKA